METIRVSFEEFKHAFLPMGCFTGNQIRLWKPGFNRDNLTRWVSCGELVRLRQDLYAFPNLHETPSSTLLLSQKIYQPSYISLHTALHFRGVIPEEVAQITAVTTRKTAQFQNEFGQYTYHHIARRFMFGFEILHPQDGGLPLAMATPEKAIIDLLHLNPSYMAAKDMRNLRLDEDFMADSFDATRFSKYLERIDSPTLSGRASTLLEAYRD